MYNAIEKERTPSLVKFKIMIPYIADTVYGFYQMNFIPSHPAYILALAAF